MVKKLFTLSDEIGELLGQEKNQSALVDGLLHAYYQVPLVGNGRHHQARVELQDTIGETAVAYETEDELPDYEGLASFKTDVVEESPPEPTPVVEPTPEPVVEPIVEPTPVEEPVLVASGQVPNTELKINYLGTTGGVCDLHGAHAGSICIDCL